MHNSTLTQWMMFALVFIMATIENIHFGGNMFPASDAELICDLLLTVLLFQAVAYRRDK